MYLTQEQANDKDLIVRLASQAMQRPVKTVQALNGQISYNYEINHDTIFKLPSHRTNEEYWIDQSQYMPQLQKKLTYQIPVPIAHEIKLPQGKVTACFYPKIQGHTFSKSSFYQKPFSQKVTFFEELSDAVYQLHNIQPDSLPVKFKTYLDRIALFLFKDSPNKQKEFKTRVQYFFQEKGVPLQHNILCHTDLHSGNVVLDSKNHIVGLLDWDSLCLGASFMEFHPLLYRSDDLNLFRQIYQKCTNQNVNEKATKCMEELYTMLFLYAFSSLTSPKNFKEKNKPCLISKKDIQRVFSVDTDRWTNFGRD